MVELGIWTSDIFLLVILCDYSSRLMGVPHYYIGCHSAHWYLDITREHMVGNSGSYPKPFETSES